MKKRRWVIVCICAACVMAVLLSGCSELSGVYASQNELSFAIVNLEADNVGVGNHHIMIPDNIDARLISDINIVYMGDLHDVLNQGLWECRVEIEYLMHFLAIDISALIDDISEFLVFEFLSSCEEILGHSISHSPIHNSHVATLECFNIDLTEIAMH